MTSVGEYSLVQNLHYLSESQATTSNNIANTSSTGFKRRIPVPVGAGSSFSDFLGSTIPQTKFSQHIDWSVGSIVRTDDPSNIALEDKNLFFKVRTPNGSFAYTRASKFAIDDQGQLTVANGDIVLDDADEPLSMAAAESGGRTSFEQLLITANGTVTMDGTAKKMGIYEIHDLHNLRPIGKGNYHYSNSVRPAAAQTNHVRQRYMEQSNVDTMGEMVHMITNQRGFSSTMSALTTLGKIRDAYVSAFNR